MYNHHKFQANKNSGGFTMRILFCSDALTIDGVASYIFNTGAALKRAGNEVAVIGRWSLKGGFQERYRHEGFKVITCPSVSVGNMYFDVRAKLFRPDVIMTDPRRSFPLASRIKRLTHAPVITYFLDPVEKTDRPGRDIDSLVKYSDVFTAFEPDTLTQLHGLGTSIPVVKMPRPLDVFFAPSEVPSRESFSILCFGRLSRYKTPGIFHLLGNLRAIQNHIPDFVINILGGGGWRFIKLKYYAHKLNKEIGRQCVKVIGTQSDPRRFIESANLVAASATSAMEAAYSMRPVIAMCSGYFGPLRNDNLDEGLRSYFSERYGEKDFSRLIPDILSIYDRYHDDDFRDGLRKISARLGDEFSEIETVKIFDGIMRMIKG